MNRTEALVHLRKAAKRYGAKTELAQALGYTRATIREKLKRDDGFTNEELEQANLALGIAEAHRQLEDHADGNLDDSLKPAHKAELERLRRKVAAIEEGEGNAVGPDKGFVMIPRYDVQASAGPGMFADQEQVIDYMAFQRGWVRRVLRANPDDLVLISAEGDSMEPAVRSGDLLLVDTAVTAFRDDAIYVVVLAGKLLVKRVQSFFDGAVTIKSDNAAYVEQTIASEEVDQIQVAGRVRWIGRLI